MNVFNSTKVHPLDPQLHRDSGSILDLGDTQDTSNVQAFRRQFDWEEFLEDFNVQIEDKTGTKSDLYLLNGDPIKRQNSIGSSGIVELTGEVMKAFGLEFLSLLSDVQVDACIDRKIPLLEVLEQIECLDFAKLFGSKLIIWIEDEPAEERDRSLSFGRLLITELLRREIEPQILLPCHDLDEEVLLALISNLIPEEVHVDSLGIASDVVEEILHKLFKIGLLLSFAAKKCNIIVIDADHAFYGVQDFHHLMDFGKQLGHKVMYLRNTPEILDKGEAVQALVSKVVAWMSKDNIADQNHAGGSQNSQEVKIRKAELAKSLIEEDLGLGLEGPSKMSKFTIETETAEALASKISQLSQPTTQIADQFRVGHGSTEIIHKLSRNHFTLPEPDTETDSSDSI